MLIYLIRWGNRNDSFAKRPISVKCIFLIYLFVVIYTVFHSHLSFNMYIPTCKYNDRTSWRGHPFKLIFFFFCKWLWFVDTFTNLFSTFTLSKRKIQIQVSTFKGVNSQTITINNNIRFGIFVDRWSRSENCVKLSRQYGLFYSFAHLQIVHVPKAIRRRFWQTKNPFCYLEGGKKIIIVVNRAGPGFFSLSGRLPPNTQYRLNFLKFWTKWKDIWSDDGGLFCSTLWVHSRNLELSIGS